jgi:hypothetical protein
LQYLASRFNFKKSLSLWGEDALSPFFYFGFLPKVAVVYLQAGMCQVKKFEKVPNTEIRLVCSKADT